MIYAYDILMTFSFSFLFFTHDFLVICLRFLHFPEPMQMKETMQNSNSFHDSYENSKGNHRKSYDIHKKITRKSHAIKNIRRKSWENKIILGKSLEHRKNYELQMHFIGFSYDFCLIRDSFLRFGEN